MSKKETKQADPKYYEYAMKISTLLVEMFDNEECQSYIGYDELTEEDNFKHFIHALANVVPCILVSKLSPQKGVFNNLEMNHLANKLCFEFMPKEG